MLAAIANVDSVAFSMNGNDLRIDWTGYGDSYKVSYSADGVNWTENDVGDDTGVTISSLTQGTYYNFRIMTHYDGGAKALEEPEDTQPDYYGYVIPQGLVPPTKCKVIDESATQITIGWTAPNGTWTFIVTWIDADTGEPQGQTTATTNDNTPEVTLTGLDPNRNYQIYISITKNDEIVDGDCYIDKQKVCCT